MKRDIRKASVVSGKTVYIEKRDIGYYAYDSKFDALLGRVSPSLVHMYTQKEMMRAYKTGLLNKTY